MHRPTVRSVMTTELLTVGPDDRLDLAALVMDRRCIRQLIVVDPDGCLLGLVSYRALLRLLATQGFDDVAGRRAVAEYMESEPVTVAPDTPLADAIWLMLDRDVSVLPVVEDGAVLGILSEHDVARVAGRLLDRPAGAPPDRPDR